MRTTVIHMHVTQEYLYISLQKMNGCFNPVLVTSVSCLNALHHQVQEVPLAVLHSKELMANFSVEHLTAVYNRWTGLVDWTSGLDYWTHLFT